LIKSLKYIAIIVLVIIFGTCSEPYTPEISKYENILVIDGFITNDQGPYTVRLSRSFKYGETESLPEQNAVVFVKDDQGNIASFEETSPGLYSTIDPDFRGLIGRQYQLYVNTNDLQTYESEFVELKKVPAIENLYAEFGEKTGKTELEQGFYIYVDTYDPENQTRYYRYDYVETWQFGVPYPSHYIVEDGLLVFRTEEVGSCWKTVNSEDILVTTSENMQSDIIRRFPVHFVSTVSNRLTIRYSILVRQYSITREAYVFWEQLKATNQEMGTLFDKQPAQVKGNIYNVDNIESPVIGFFEASCVDSKRIFLTHSNVPAGTKLTSGFADCYSQYLIIPKNNYLEYSNRGYCMVLDASNEQILFGLGVVSTFRCCDCTLTGSAIRPDFW
jgi:hypothetical protein